MMYTLPCRYAVVQRFVTIYAPIETATIEEDVVEEGIYIVKLSDDDSKLRN